MLYHRASVTPKSSRSRWRNCPRRWPARSVNPSSARAPKPAARHGDRASTGWQLLLRGPSKRERRRRGRRPTPRTLRCRRRRERPPQQRADRRRSRRGRPPPPMPSPGRRRPAGQRSAQREISQADRVGDSGAERPWLPRRLVDRDPHRDSLSHRPYRLQAWAGSSTSSSPAGARASIARTAWSTLHAPFASKRSAAYGPAAARTAATLAASSPTPTLIFRQVKP